MNPDADNAIKTHPEKPIGAEPPEQRSQVPRRTVDIDQMERQTIALTSDEFRRVLNHVATSLGRPSAWPATKNYPDGLALCVIDAVQSTGITYASATGVIERYRQHRRILGANPESDGADDLLATFNTLGSTNAWMTEIGNRHRTSTNRDSPFTAEAVRTAAFILVELGLTSTQLVRQSTDDELELLHRNWLDVAGQGDGVSWRHLLMLAGVDNPKPDRLTVRFVADALDLPRQEITHEFARSAIESASEALKVTPPRLEQSIWNWQRTNL